MKAGNENPLKILLVEDDEDDYILAEDLLEEAMGGGFELDWVSEYDAGLEEIRHCRHELYMLDYRLGDRSGLELMREAMALGCYKPMILLTGQGDQEIDAEAMRSGAADYLVKGEIDAPLLERSVRHSLERWRTLDRLRESEERYALAAQGANDGLWDWDIKTDTVYRSERWKAMLGFGEEEIGEKPSEWLERIHRDDGQSTRRELHRHLSGEVEQFEVEHRVLHADGNYRWMLDRGIAVRDESGEAYRMAGSQTDITERKRVEEQLVHDAFHDAVTELPNRQLFSDRVERAMVRSQRREDYAFAVRLLDLDHFKVINDSLGHVLGDRLLVAVGERLESGLRPGDTLARFGGDEFALLLEDIDGVSEATRQADRIQRDLSPPFDVDGNEVFTSASIGVVVGEPRYGGVEEVLRDADAAMYRAKEAGKTGYEVFDTEMHGRAVERLRLEGELRRGVERGEFTLHYQPIIATETGAISGCEALARWEHPERGLVSPGEFIPLAEETGLVVDLGWEFLRVACEQGRAWHEAGYEGLSVSVNFSAQQFQRPDLAERVEETLRDTGMSPGCLAIEVTESTAVENVELVSSSLQELRDFGVRIYIDDFGTGYSSLGYLKSLTADTLKFDRSYIQGLPDDPSDRAIASALVTLSRGLGLKMVAEGVETAEQADYLRELGCDELQGFFFAKPLPAEDFRKLLDAAPFNLSNSGHASS